MNQLATQQERIPMDAVGVTNTGNGTKIAPQNLGEVVKFAEVMSRADIALPKHLRGNAGACMAVALQALEWQMSPFAVASKSYSVGGAIAYEAQLIAAVVNTRSGIKGRLRYQFDGEGSALTCTVTGVLDGEECVYTSPTIGSITTKNSPLWKSDPQQQLGYFAARSWARRHCPEVILGVYDRDEAEDFRGPDKAKDITPAASFDPLSDEPIAQQLTTKTQVDEYVDQSTGEILEPDTHTESGAPSSPDHADAPALSASAEAGEVFPNSPASSFNHDAEDDDDQLFPADRADLIECAKEMLSLAGLKYSNDQERDEALQQSKAQWEGRLKDLHPQIGSIFVSAKAVATGKRTSAQAKSFLSGPLECTVEELGGQVDG
jgi:hypothetical protein